MFKLFDSNGREGLRILLKNVPTDFSRFWKCSCCGSTIYQVQVTTMPQYSCLCGEKKWTAETRVFN